MFYVYLGGDPVQGKVAFLRLDDAFAFADGRDVVDEYGAIMEQPDKHIVKLEADSIFWDIHVIPTNEREYDQDIFELRWGWTAGFSEDDWENIADDAPTGHVSVKILASQARALVERLNGLLATHKD